MKKKCYCDMITSENKKYYNEIPGIAKSITQTFFNNTTVRHIGSTQIPTKKIIIYILKEIEKIIFPGYFEEQNLSQDILEYHIGIKLNNLLETLSNQISKSLRHELEKEQFETCIDCHNKSKKITLKFLNQLSEIRLLISEDIKAAFEGDPAAKSYDEIVFSYPSIKAILTYRIANALYKLKVPLIPRIMSEYAHSRTGIDIHPGATIGKSFFIDHGTGVVIGETTIIGNNVKIYQGVTLGALSLNKQKLDLSSKRHPTIEDNVVIYSNATILGGETVIGKSSVIGGNVWIIKSVEPRTTIMKRIPEVKIKKKENNENITC